MFGAGSYTYRLVEGWESCHRDGNWAMLPAWGWTAATVSTCSIAASHPLCVFDRDGNFVTSWGDGVFRRAHGVHMGPDDTIYLTDEGDHTVRKCTLDGQVLLTLGISAAPASFMSGEPFRRCTHTALSPAGEIYVSDGYGNARIQKYAPDCKRLMSWGEPGAGPGQFNLPHNIACDADGWVYVADRENHRIQVFDGSGRFETQWHDLHRPSGMFMPAGNALLLRRRDRAVLRVQPRRAESRTADHDPVERGQAPCADREEPAAGWLRAIHLAAWSRGRFARRPLCGGSVVHRMAESVSVDTEAESHCAAFRSSSASQDRRINRRRRRAQKRGVDLSIAAAYSWRRYMPNQSPRLDRVFQALADPTRRAVIERLRQGPAAVSELAQPFRMALPSIRSTSTCWKAAVSSGRARRGACARIGWRRRR